MVDVFRSHWPGTRGSRTGARQNVDAGSSSATAAASTGQNLTRTLPSRRCSLASAPVRVRNRCGAGERPDSDRLTPISPPRVKYVDLLRPVVLGHPSAAAESSAGTFVLSAIFVSRSGAASWTRYPTPIEALAPPAAECERVNARGLETQSYPRTGLRMTSDVAEARPLSPGSGEGSRQAEACDRRSEERAGVPSTRLAAGPLVPDRAWRSDARLGAIVGELGPDGST